MKLFLTVITMMAILMFSIGAMAATSTATFNVTATAASNCRITGTTNVAFGDYDPTNATPADAMGNMTFRCTKGTTYWLYITGTRSMSSTPAGETLNFELYTDAARTASFPLVKTGAGTSSANNAAQIQNIYGRIPAEQDVTAGRTFLQTLTATVEY